MIELQITKTCMFATTGKSAGWQRYDREHKEFPDMAAARAWLAGEYGKAKRAPIYQDKPDGGAQRVGWVIGFRPKYRSKGEAMLEQHWIEFRESRLIDPTA